MGALTDPRARFSLGFTENLRFSRARPGWTHFHCDVCFLGTQVAEAEQAGVAASAASAGETRSPRGVVSSPGAFYFHFIGRRRSLRFRIRGVETGPEVRIYNPGQTWPTR